LKKIYNISLEKKYITYFFFLFIKMSDNLLLTILGAVGVGALVMGLNKNDQTIREDWNMIPSFQKTNVTAQIQGNNISTANFARNVPLHNAVQTVSRLQRAGVSQDEQVAHLKAQAVSSNSRNKAALQRAFNPSQLTQQSVEHYSSPSQLGSSAVTGNDYVSYPQFNQSTPLQSPSLNLPAQIRYNPPSLNNMGITESYQSQPMDYAGLIEGFSDKPNRMNVATYVQNPSGINVQGGQLNQGTGYVANVDSFVGAMNQGNKKYSDQKDIVQGTLPLSTMESGVQGNAAVQNVVNYDQFVYSTGKRGGWRSSSSGGSDLIRGDLAVCVDPCQKGWFQSSLQPKDLTVGAMNVLMGSGESSENDTTAKFARSYGNVSQPVRQGQSATMSTLQKSLMASGSANLTSTTSFA
jgi:hypothetical protein